MQIIIFSQHFISFSLQFLGFFFNVNASKPIIKTIPCRRSDSLFSCNGTCDCCCVSGFGRSFWRKFPCAFYPVFRRRPEFGNFYWIFSVYWKTIKIWLNRQNLNVDCVTLYTLQASSFDCPSTTVTTTAQTINTNKKFMLMNNAAINRNWSEYRIEPRATIVLVPLSLCRCQLLLMPMR